MAYLKRGAKRNQLRAQQSDRGASFASCHDFELYALLRFLPSIHSSSAAAPNLVLAPPLQPASIPKKNRVPVGSREPTDIGLHSPLSSCRIEAGNRHNEVI